MEKQMTPEKSQLAEEALRAYSFEKTEVSFIRHNENITCRAVADGNTYALRIHQPVEGFSLKLFWQGKEKNLMRGETELLLHLTKTAPFPVQTPVKNRRGEYVTVLSDGTEAQLLSWIDGRTLTGEDLSSCAEELGKLAAQINAAARGFSGERISYSYGLVRRMKSEVMSAGTQGHLTQEEARICGGVLDEIERIMAQLDAQPDSKCLIHADLSTDNILKTPTGLAPIDFSLSGFGYRAQECGMLAYNYDNEKEREAVRASYEAASGVTIRPRHMKAFGIFSILAFIAAQHDRYWKEAWFREAMVRWMDTEFSELLKGS